MDEIIEDAQAFNEGYERGFKEGNKSGFKQGIEWVSKKESEEDGEIIAHNECFLSGYVKGIQEEREHCVKMIKACIKIRKEKFFTSEPEKQQRYEHEISALRQAIGMIDGVIDG